jgi:uncharacterized protein (DUF1499 family)
MTRALSRIALTVAILCAIVLALSGPGYRLGWWELGVAFGMLRWTAWVAIGATVVGVILAFIAGVFRPGGSRAGLVEAIAAMVIGAATMTGPLMLMSRGKSVPPIHDISTDTDDPPQFVSVLPLRAGAANPATYGGPEIAAQQKKAFPRIVPLELTDPPPRAYERALAAARDMGWTIVSADSGAGRIEATATTPFFGFKDDVVVRVAPSPRGSRIDVRSLSRIGGSDLGTNARRVESYLDKINAG